MRHDPRILLVSLALVTFAGCEPPGGSGTDSGNAFQAQLTVAGEGALASGARGVGTLSRATLHLNEVEFEPCEGAGEDAEVDYEGDYTSDLLAGSDLGVVELSIASICEVKVEAEDEPSIVIEGDTTGGAAFALTSDRNWEFRVESEVDLGADALNRVALLFDLDAWLDGVDADLGVAGDDGVIRIDDANNSELLDLFEDNVQASGRFEREDD
jgi:hypothetical protein